MLSSIFLSAIFLASTAICDETNSYFTGPLKATGNDNYADNPVYQLNKIMKIEWATTMPAYSIFLSQIDLSTKDASLGKAVYTLYKGTQSPSVYLYKNWTISTQSFDLRQSNVFMFALAINDKLDGVVLSRTFNVSSSSTSPGTFASGKADNSNGNNDDSDGEDTTIMLTITQTRSVGSNMTASMSVTSTDALTSSDYSSYSYATTPGPTTVPFTYSAPRTSTTGAAISTISNGSGARVLYSYETATKVLLGAFLSWSGLLLV